MEFGSKTIGEWDWENLDSYSGRTTEIEVVENGSMYSSGDGVVFSGSDLGHNSCSKNSISASLESSSLPSDLSDKEEILGADRDGNFPSAGLPVSSSEPMIGLKLGRRIYFEDVCTASSSTKTTSVSATPSSSSSSSIPTTKRSRASYQCNQTPRCQVEGCNLDLSSAKDYHRRHRICEAHSKSPKVIVAGMERRFCQQCSRFHDLLEFDDKKRSCRRRLSDHNARRRRPRPEAIPFGSARLSSSLYDRRLPINFLLNRVPSTVANPQLGSAYNFKVAVAVDPPIGPPKAGFFGRKPQLPSYEIPSAVSTLQLGPDRVPPFLVPQVFNHGTSSITSNPDVAPDICRALSLLSTNSWSLNEAGSTSLEQLVLGSHTSVCHPAMQLEQQNWAVPSSDYIRMEESESRVHSLDFHNIGSSQFQEFQLFKGPQGSNDFYSNQIN